jgi:hypothetical protein
MSDEQHIGNWWIWKVFWILLGITAFEVMLGILKVDGYLPEFLVFDTFSGSCLANSYLYCFNFNKSWIYCFGIYALRF